MRQPSAAFQRINSRRYTYVATCEAGCVIGLLPEVPFDASRSTQDMLDDRAAGQRQANWLLSMISRSALIVLLPSHLAPLRVETCPHPTPEYKQDLSKLKVKPKPKPKKQLSLF